MGILRTFQRELKGADWRTCVAGGLVALLLAGLACLIGGGSASYAQLCGECSPNFGKIWVICRQCAAGLLGAAWGLYEGQCCTRNGWRKQGRIRWLSGMISMLIWMVLFLSGGCEILSVLLYAWAIYSFISAIEWFLRESLLSGVLLGSVVLWMMGNFLISLRIILWN